MKLSAAVEWLARGLAVLGGIALVMVTGITVVSVAGRAFVQQGLGPLPGDFELVETLTAFAVFSFLPWCQLRRGHAEVDVFTRFLPERANRLIDAVVEVVMTLMVILIAWRLWQGLLDKRLYGETTFILQFPVWWGFAAALAAASTGVVVSIHVAVSRMRALFIPAPEGRGDAA